MGADENKIQVKKMKNENWTENGYSEHGQVVMWISPHDGQMMMFVKIEGMELIEGVDVGAWINYVETDEPFITNEMVEYYGIDADNGHHFISGMALFAYPMTHRPYDAQWLEMYDRMTDGLVEINLYE